MNFAPTWPLPAATSRPERRGTGGRRGFCRSHGGMASAVEGAPRPFGPNRRSWSRHKRPTIFLLSIVASTQRSSTSWLWGFAVDLGSIRAIYRRLIIRHYGWVRRHSGERPDGVVGDLAAMFARQIIKWHGAPTQVREAVTDLAAPFFEIFYGLRKKLDGFGLAAYWETAAPALGKSGFADLHPSDEDIETWSRYLKEMASLPAQHAAMLSATDYELIRARRLVLLVFGYLDRVTRAAQCEEELADFGRCLLIAFGRPAVPILITVLATNPYVTRSSRPFWILSACCHGHRYGRACAWVPILRAPTIENFCRVVAPCRLSSYPPVLLDSGRARPPPARTSRQRRLERSLRRTARQRLPTPIANQRRHEHRPAAHSRSHNPPAVSHSR